MGSPFKTWLQGLLGPPGKFPLANCPPGNPLTRPPRQPPPPTCLNRRRLLSPSECFPLSSTLERILARTSPSGRPRWVTSPLSYSPSEAAPLLKPPSPPSPKSPSPRVIGSRHDASSLIHLGWWWPYCSALAPAGVVPPSWCVHTWGTPLLDSQVPSLLTCTCPCLPGALVSCSCGLLGRKELRARQTQCLHFFKN